MKTFIKLKTVSPFVFLLCLMIAPLCFTGCDSNAGNQGSIQLSIQDDVNSRTLLPSLDMNISSYRITASGPFGECLTETLSGSSLTFDNLAAGTWTITAEGLNSSSEVVGSGVSVVEVVGGDTAQTTVTIVPLDGQGTLSLNASWTEGEIDQPRFDAYVIQGIGGQVSVPFTVTGATASGQVSLPAGYHSLILKIYNSADQLVASCVEVVRIAAGADTVGNMTFSEIKNQGNSLNIAIVLDMQDPLDVSIPEEGPVFQEGSALSFSAAVVETLPGLVYCWYLDGTMIHEGETLNLAGLVKNAYRLDVTVFTADGTRGGSAGFTFRVTEESVNPDYLAISRIQGAGHNSPYAGQSVENIIGIVTAKDGKGFWMQSPALYEDTDPATSEGLLVYLNSAPSVSVGDKVLVSGTVVEYQRDDLALTEISNPVVTTLETGCTLPEAVVLGTGGRIPPSLVIDNDSFSVFDPAEDGIDFYESVESMLVQVNNALVVGGTKYGEIPVVSDNGAHVPSGVMSERGGLVVQENSFNPELIYIDTDTYLLADRTPVGAKAGDRIADPVVGIMTYDTRYAKYLLLPVEKPVVVDGTLPREVTSIVGDSTTLTVATFNMENFPRDFEGMSAAEIQAKIDDMGETIAVALNSPDIIGLVEVTDNSYSDNDGVTSASANYEALAAAVTAAGGAAYAYSEIAPANLQDGGWPGANIRVGFLYNSERVGFTPSGTPGPNDAVQVVSVGTDVTLSTNPGRIDPSAFGNSRKPLAGHFTFNGEDVFVVVNHFNSKGGDTQLFGGAQPPLQNSEAERLVQVAAVNQFCDDLLAADPQANIIVMGDLNDFQFSNPIRTLKADILFNLTEELLAPNEQYTYIYNGNSQQLDHILVSNNLMMADPLVDIVHRYAEYFTFGNDAYTGYNRQTDHDPLVASFNFNGGVTPEEGSLMFVDYGEGSSNNKYFELMNTGSAAVNLEDYLILLASNGAALDVAGVRQFGAGITLEPGIVYGLYNSSAAPEIASKMDEVSSAANFNGNDSLVLVLDVDGDNTYTSADTILDVIGYVGSADSFGANKGLKRDPSVTIGNPVFDLSEWQEYDQGVVDSGAECGIH